MVFWCRLPRDLCNRLAGWHILYPSEFLGLWQKLNVRT
jgi:hypothetical protein